MVGSTNELVIEGVTGFLVTSGDVDQLADHIGFLMSGTMRKAADMGRSGATFVNNNFGIEKVVVRLENLFRNIKNSNA